MDYFVWAAIGEDRSFVVDTGFTEEVARRRGREWLRCPAEALGAPLETRLEPVEGSRQVPNGSREPAGQTVQDPLEPFELPSQPPGQ